MVITLINLLHIDITLTISTLDGYYFDRSTPEKNNCDYIYSKQL